MNILAKFLIVLGLVFVGVGILVGIAGKMPGLGRLPGDVYLRKGSFTFYFPLATSLVVSLILTLIVNLFWKK
ncbi:MAG TPA: DUF2905 domain-containing protein [Candidatus Omnitrophota bacterium]|nr:DUF2905 domain-containing protein [Candidatus Omnitrophota bacterium]